MYSVEGAYAKIARRLVKGPGECIEFDGARTAYGYGLITYEHENFYTHRVSFEYHRGLIPEGMVVMHTCDNPACVNPDHLRIGTKQDNTNDMIQKGRQFHPPVRSCRGPLNDEEKQAIDSMAGVVSGPQIARCLGLSVSTVYRRIHATREVEV